MEMQIHVLEKCVFALIRHLQVGNFQYLVSSNHILCFVSPILKCKKIHQHNVQSTDKLERYSKNVQSLCVLTGYIKS